MQTKKGSIVFKIVVAAAVILVAFVICSLNQPSEQSLQLLMMFGLGVVVLISVGAVTIPYLTEGSQKDYGRAVERTFFCLVVVVLTLVTSGFFISAWNLALGVSGAVGLLGVLMVLI